MVPKILVVDDEASLERLIKQRFRKQIRAHELEFIFAGNGREALEKILQEAQVEIIFTDINMPEMDGLTLLEKLSELENPIKTVVVSAYGDMQNIRTAMNRGAFDFLTKPIDFEDLEITLNRSLEAVQKQKENIRQLQQAQAQLVQSEKLVSIGQLVAGVAHEINNPIGFISGNLDYVENYVQDLLKLLELYRTELDRPSDAIQTQIEAMELEFILEDLPQLLASMQEGTDRICKLSQSLRNFSRVDRDRQVSANIHEGIESTLMILKHRLKANQKRPEISINKNYGDLPEVACYPSQLNQVFLNIIANAVEAFDEFHEAASAEPDKTYSYTIAIKTEVSHLPWSPNPQELSDPLTRSDLSENQATDDIDSAPQFAIIRIQDNGPGIPDGIKQHIFEPFFTTKPVGKGTGLGLSIAKSIVVEKHGGRIYCFSESGRGSEFLIELPLNTGGT